jgi:(p)ppGpp synthase/HD superfamily hydrolase
MSIGVFDKAISFAIRHYGSDTRKDGNTPYLLHAFRVVETLRKLAKVQDPIVLAAALLHDVLEDTPVKRDELERSLGRRVADLVASLTEDKRLPKAERKATMLSQFETLPSDAKLIKLADRLDNARSPWLRNSSIRNRYARETSIILHKAIGICPPLESQLRLAIHSLSSLRMPRSRRTPRAQ